MLGAVAQATTTRHGTPLALLVAGLLVVGNLAAAATANQSPRDDASEVFLGQSTCSTSEACSLFWDRAGGTGAAA